MNIEFEYARDASYLRQRVRNAFRGGDWVVGVFVAGLLGIAALCLPTGDGRAVGAGLLSCALAVATLQMYVERRRQAFRNPPVFLELTAFVITEEGVATESSSAAWRRSWSAIAKATETPIAYLLITDGGPYLDVPRAGLTSEQDDELRQFLIARRLLRPRNGFPLPEPAR